MGGIVLAGKVNEIFSLKNKTRRVRGLLLAPVLKKIEFTCTQMESDWPPWSSRASLWTEPKSAQCGEMILIHACKLFTWPSVGVKWQMFDGWH